MNKKIKSIKKDVLKKTEKIIDNVKEDISDEIDEFDLHRYEDVLTDLYDELDIDISLDLWAGK